MLINGEWRDCLSISDRGFQYGDGVFETIALTNHTPHLLDEHLERLLSGCERLQITPPDINLLSDEIAQVSLSNNDASAVLKLIITRGQGGRGYVPPRQQPTRIIYVAPWPDYPEEKHRQGILSFICRTRLGLNPSLAGIKHLNRLEQVMASDERATGGYSEGVVLDIEGRVIEGTMSNLFLVSEGALVTPDLESSGVAGIVRRLVIGVAEQLNIAVIVKEVQVEDLQNADALFFTNSLIGIWPVVACNGVNYDIKSINKKLIDQVMLRALGRH